MMYFSRVHIRPDIFKPSQLAAVLANNVHGAHRLLWDLFPNQSRRTFLYREEIAREQLGALPSVRGAPIYYLLSKFEPVTHAESLFRVDSKSYCPKLENGQRLIFECRVNPVVTRQRKKHDVVMNAQLRFLQSLVQELDLEIMLPEKPGKSDFKRVLIEKGGENLHRRLNDRLQGDPRYFERLINIARLPDLLEWALKGYCDLELENWLKRQGSRLGFKLVPEGIGMTKLQDSTYRWHVLSGKGSKGDKSGFSSVDFCGELQITELAKFERAMFQGIGRSKAFGCGLLLIRRAIHD